VETGHDVPEEGPAQTADPSSDLDASEHAPSSGALESTSSDPEGQPLGSATEPGSIDWDLGAGGEPSAEGHQFHSSVTPPTVPEDRDASSAPGDGGRRPRKVLVKVAILGVVCALLGGVAGGLVARHIGSSNVTIVRSSSTPGAAILPNGMPIPTLVRQALPSIVSIDVKNNGSEDQGTGMIISSSGMVVTNNHVIALASGGGTITITRSGSTSAMPTTLIGTDPTNDVALLQIAGASGLPTVTMGDSNKVVVGDAAVAIGNALGLAAGTPTVTQGIISALGRTVTAGDSSGNSTETLTNMIQTDAAINPGNSGGPLLDSSGDVIGMNTAVAGSSSTGSSAQNIGFAIPSARIELLLPQLEKGGTAPTTTSGGYMGIEITTLTPDLKSQYGLVPSSGAVILYVTPGAPGAAAGLRQGDVIVAVNGRKITTADQVTEITKAAKPGDVIKVAIARGSTTHTYSVTLGTHPG